ncbi:MAG: hypothetical protein PHT33_08340 [bacterium]|nr:hypothetical protein [bacterium]
MIFNDLQECISILDIASESVFRLPAVYDADKGGPVELDEMDVQIDSLQEMLPGVHIMTVRVSNTAIVAKRLEIRVGFELADYSGLTYWDGVSSVLLEERLPVKYACNADPYEGPVYPLPDKFHPKSCEQTFVKEDVENICDEFSGIQTLCQFPAAALYDAEQCLGIGLDPRLDFSYFSSGIAPGADGFYFSVKTVLEAGEKDVPVRLLVIKSRGSYGYRHVLDAYYRSFPEVYSYRKDIDPRFFGPAETFPCYHAPECGSIVLEEFRRYYTSWTLSIFEWVMDGGFGFYLDKAWVGEDFLSVFRDDILKDRTLDEGNGLIAVGNRRLTGQCAVSNGLTYENADWRVMAEQMPDSILIRSNGRPNRRLSNMSGDACVAFVGANSYWDFLKNNIARAVAEYKPDGLYVDNCQGPRPNFNSAVPKIPARAFTDGKDYVTQGYGHALLLKYMRSFNTAAGRKMATLANTPGDYIVCRETDTAVIEGGSWLGSDSWSRGLRHLFGKKPIVQWGPKGFPGWFDYDEEAAEAVVDRHVCLARLFAVNTGCLLNTAHTVRGYSDTMAWMPLIIKLAGLGWEPVTKAMTDNRSLKIERFGDNSFSVVNFTEERQCGSAVISRQSKSEPLFVYRLLVPENVPARNDLLATESRLAMGLAPLSAVVIRPALGLRPAEDRQCRAVVTSAGDGFCEITITGLDSKTEAVIPEDDDWILTLITADGCVLDWERDSSGVPVVVLPAVSPGEELCLRIEYRHRIYVDIEAVKSFSWMKDDSRPDFSAVCPDPQEMSCKLQVERLEAYFRYYLAEKRMEELPTEKLYSFDHGNHDSRMTLRVAHYAPEFNIAVRSNVAGGGGQVILASVSQMQWMEDNLSGFHPEGDGVYACQGNLIVYAASIEAM